MTCEYFTRYGNNRVPGECASRAVLVLIDQDINPPIRVCFLHARTIVRRYPELGRLEDRFVSLDAKGSHP